MKRMKADQDLSRVGFFRWLGRLALYLSGALGLAALARFLGYLAPQTTPAEVAIGRAEDYPPNSRTLRSEAEALVVHDGQGLRALDLRCPHLGCLVQADEQGFHCPCHGSRFGPDGKVLQGPASRALGILALSEDADGNLTVSRLQ